MKIGIVDTGIDGSHPWLCGVVAGGVGVCCDPEGYDLRSEYNDLFGHGTAVGSLIHAYCAVAQLYAIRIAQQKGGFATQYVQEEAIAMGIRWCLDEGIRIINVSYSLKATEENGARIRQVCEEACKSNAIIVAAHRCGENCIVYPAALQTTIGVHHRRDLKPGQISVISRENHDLSAFGGPCCLAQRGNGVQFIGGTSIACAHVSAMVGRIREIDDSLSLEEVFAHLAESSVQ